jgi:hypothetical protein
MRPILTLSLALAALGLTTGCESGTYRDITVTVPSSVTSRFTEEAPGVLVIPEVSGRGGTYALCGQEEPEPLQFAFDSLFSCRPEKGERDVLVEAWVDEAPAGWTAEEICGALRTDRGLAYDGDREAEPTDSGDTGVQGTDPVLELAETPEEGWAYGAVEATWKGDASPCGGTLRAELAVR